MTDIGPADAFGYGSVLLGYVLLTAAVGGVLLAGGAVLAERAGLSLTSPSVAALSQPRGAASAVLVVAGAGVSLAGAFGLVYKLIADAARVGVGAAVDAPVAVEVESRSVERTSARSTGAETARDARDPSAGGGSDEAGAFGVGPVPSADDSGTVDPGESRGAPGDVEAGGAPEPVPAEDPADAGTVGAGGTAPGTTDVEGGGAGIETGAAGDEESSRPDPSPSAAADRGSDAGGAGSLGTGDESPPGSVGGPAGPVDEARPPDDEKPREEAPPRGSDDLLTAEGDDSFDPIPGGETTGAGSDDDGPDHPADPSSTAGEPIGTGAGTDDRPAGSEGGPGESPPPVEERETRIQPGSSGDEPSGSSPDDPAAGDGPAGGDRGDERPGADLFEGDETDDRTEEWTPPDPSEFESLSPGEEDGGSGGPLSGENVEPADGGGDADAGEEGTSTGTEDDDDPLDDRLSGG